jgi:hypothetical protein
VVVNEQHVWPGGTGVSHVPPPRSGVSLRKVGVTVMLVIAAVPIGCMCHGAWQTWAETKRAGELKRLQRAAQLVGERVDEAARHEGSRIASGFPKDGDHVYRDDRGECLGKDSWEDGRLRRRILYRSGQTGSCEDQLAAERYYYQSDDADDRAWNRARKKVRTYVNSARQIFLLDEFTATGLLKRKEHCLEGFKAKGEELECEHSVSLDDQMRSPLPSMSILVPSLNGVSPPIPVYR